jgi:hypothetical protein
VQLHVLPSFVQLVLSQEGLAGSTRLFLEVDHLDMLGKLTKGTLHVTATVWAFKFQSGAYFSMILSLSHLKVFLAFIALRGEMICEVDNLLSLQQLVYERFR